jgi:hypothetical protein
LITQTQGSVSPLTDCQVTSLVATFDRLSPVLFGFLILYIFVKGLAEAASTALWGDELFTLALAHQPRASILWNALAHGADGQPPLYYLVERIFAAVITNPHIALRLPSVIAFCCTVACVYVFVRRHASCGQALVCAAALLNTDLYVRYAVQARPYSLAVACIALAMVCYQRASAPLWAFLLFFSLSLAVSLHYYAVFALGAFAAAEAAFYWTQHKLRAGAWLAIFCGGLPLVVFWPLVNAQKQIYGQHFWAQPRLFATLAAYGSFFGLPTFIGISLVAVLGLGLVATEKWSSIAARDFASLTDSQFHEHVLILTLLLMPFIVFLAARFAHGGFLTRYVLWVTVAVAVLLGHFLPRMSRWSFLVLAVSLFLAVAGQEAQSLYSLRGRIGKIVSPASSVEKLVASAGRPDLPVVVWADYFVISYYASREYEKRMVAFTDPTSAIAYIGTDTSDKLFSLMGGYGPFKVYDFASFASTHRSFLLYSSALNSPQQGTTFFYDWWVPKLLHNGYSLQLVAAEGDTRMYLVCSPDYN